MRVTSSYSINPAKERTEIWNGSNWEQISPQEILESDYKFYRVLTPNHTLYYEVISRLERVTEYIGGIPVTTSSNRITSELEILSIQTYKREQEYKLPEY